MIENKLMEGLLFAAAKPLTYETLSEIFEVSLEEVFASVQDLMNNLAELDRGIQIRIVNNTVELISHADCGTYIEKIRHREESLSKAAIETIAIIAFKQPITKAEIEEIRGVNCERILRQLQERNLIIDLGRKQVVGRPILYGTTETFLRSIGASSLDSLKEEIQDVDLLSIIGTSYPEETLF